MSELSDDLAQRSATAVRKIIRKQQKHKGVAQAQAARARKNRAVMLATEADRQIEKLTKELAGARADAERDRIARELVYRRLQRLAAPS